MARRKLRLEHHRSRPLSAELIRQADRVVCMGPGHRQIAIGLVPEAAERVLLLNAPDGIADPIGCDLDEYRRCGECIDRGLDALIESGKL